MRQRLNVTTAPILAVALIAGCASHRPVAQLDATDLAELAALRPELEGRRVAVISGPSAAVDATRRIEDALRELGTVPVAPADGPTSVCVEVDGPERTLQPIASGEAHAFFFVITLGMWPQSYGHPEEWRFRIADAGGRAEAVVAETTRRTLCGWLAGPLSLLPGWSFDGGGCRSVPEGEDERANRRARAVRDLAMQIAAFVRRE